MSVIQISKIQIRRGKKNSNSGIPQLSSAELAWAVDSQELYIGNGSVAEGAPYVGNTKILTEHDNILELASSYRFASDDISVYRSVSRQLQGKLDEYVSVLDYGAIPDGSTDCTDAFETAFTELFIEGDLKYRKVLMVPNGVYVFARDLQIPSYVHLQGETRDGAVLEFSVNNIRLITSTGESSPSSFSSTNRPTDIRMSNLTISRTTGSTTLSGLINGRFENVKWTGNYDIANVTQPSDLSVTPGAVFWNNQTEDVVVTATEFINCFFDGVQLGVKCLQTKFAESVVKFNNCHWFNVNTGVYIEATPGQLTSWKIHDCEFEEVYASAFKATQGRNTNFSRCKFVSCGSGNSRLPGSAPTTNIIYFGDNRANTVHDCTFDRPQRFNVVTDSSVLAIAEVYNSNLTTINNKIHSAIFFSEGLTKPLAVLSAFNKFIYVNYHLRLGGHSRIGQLTLTINDDINKVSITDQYQYSDSSTTSEGGAIMSNFEFGAELQDNGSVVRENQPGDSTLMFDTVAIIYKNPTLTGATGDIIFDVSYGV